MISMEQIILDHNEYLRLKRYESKGERQERLNDIIKRLEEKKKKLIEEVHVLSETTYPNTRAFGYGVLCGVIFGITLCSIIAILIYLR